MYQAHRSNTASPSILPPILPPIHKTPQLSPSSLPHLHDVLPDFIPSPASTSKYRISDNHVYDHPTTLRITPDLPQPSNFPRPLSPDPSLNKMSMYTFVTSPPSRSSVSSPQPFLEAGSQVHSTAQLLKTNLRLHQQRQIVYVNRMLMPPVHRVGNVTQGAKPSLGKSRSRTKVDFQKAMKRKIALEADPWTRDVNPEDVTCGGCAKEVPLQPGRKYYPRRWKLHKERCRAISKANKELISFERELQT